MLFLLCLILHCFAFILVLDIVCNFLLFAPRSSVFLVAMLTIETLNIMYMLLLQLCELSWRALLFCHLGIAKPA